MKATKHRYSAYSESRTIYSSGDLTDVDDEGEPFVTHPPIVNNFVDNPITVKPVAVDTKLKVMNVICESVIIVVTSPVILITAICAGLKWIFTLHYPLTTEARRMLDTRYYLQQCENEKNKVPAKRIKSPC